MSECPVCPRCGEPPLLVEETWAMCPTVSCDVLTWNPSITREANLANVVYIHNPGEIDSTEPPAPRQRPPN